MSNAVICDRCGAVCAENKATHIDEKWLFTTVHYDLCPVCRREYHDFLHPVNKEDEDHE